MTTKPRTAYHIYHHKLLKDQAPFSQITLSIPREDDANIREAKVVQSLLNDMAELRRIGAEKGIVDPKEVTIGQSTYKRELLTLKVGKGEQHKVLITGGHHGNEWNSVEVPYMIAKFLIENYTEKPSEDEAADEATIVAKRRIKHLLENREIWFVPMVNPDGHFRAMTEDRTWRTNCKMYHLPAAAITAKHYPTGVVRIIQYPEGDYGGVDINRNYPTQTWGQETHLGDHFITCRDPQSGRIWTGPRAASERETRAVAKLIRDKRFKSSISYHNFAKELLYFHGAAYLKHVAKGMSKLLNEQSRYKVVDGTKGIPSTGHIADYCFEYASGQPTLGLELPPVMKNADFYGYSWVPESTLEPTFRENLAAALALINSAGFSKPADRIRICVDDSTKQVQVVQNCWEVFKDWKL